MNPKKRYCSGVVGAASVGKCKPRDGRGRDENHWVGVGRGEGDFLGHSVEYAS